MNLNSNADEVDNWNLTSSPIKPSITKKGLTLKKKTERQMPSENEFAKNNSLLILKNLKRKKLRKMKKNL